MNLSELTEEQVNKNIASNIKNLRHNNNMTQSDFAEVLGINSRQILSNWEKGKAIPIYDIVKISKKFGVTLDEIIFGKIELKSISNNKQLFDLANKINLYNEDKNNPFWGDELLPMVGPDNILRYNVFKKGYMANMESFCTGDSSGLTNILDMYQLAFNLGLKEAAVNILKINVSLLICNKVNLDGDDGELVKEKLTGYVEALEEIEDPIGYYYRAVLLIHGLIITDKCQDDRIKEGLELMDRLSKDGNELAFRYISYFNK